MLCCLLLLTLCFLGSNAQETCDCDALQVLFKDALDDAAKNAIDIMIDSAKYPLSDNDEENEGLLGLRPDLAAESCQQLHQVNPSLRSGEYWIKPSNPVKVYCAMNK